MVITKERKKMGNGANKTPTEQNKKRIKLIINNK